MRWAPRATGPAWRSCAAGSLKSRKGINLPSVNVQAPSLTEKDLGDLDFALEMGVEYIGLSFVRQAADVIDLKDRVAGSALVVAKIEKVQALQAIEEILPETDAVMVARGDLGVELPFERVPLAQKRIVQLANYYGRPVITATQMLESMIEHPGPPGPRPPTWPTPSWTAPTRSCSPGETAVGTYPLQALEALVRIAREIERSGVLERGPRYITRPGPAGPGWRHRPGARRGRRHRGRRPPGGRARHHGHHPLRASRPGWCPATGRRCRSSPLPPTRTRTASSRRSGVCTRCWPTRST